MPGTQHRGPFDAAAHREWSRALGLTMVTDEIRKLRYCYNILHRRIADKDDGLAYWQMNLKIATYFLKRYDPEFAPEDYHYDEALLQSDEENTLTTHHLLQHPERSRRSCPKLARELELELKRKVALYFESRA